MIMEREVGEVFDFKGVALQVQDTDYMASCDDCYFDRFGHECLYERGYIGYCYRRRRSDGKDVVFVEVKSDKNKEE